MAGGGTVFPTFASKLDVTYKPVELLEATLLSKEDMIKAWTVAAQPGPARRNGTRPTFVLATSMPPRSAGIYAFYPSPAHYWLTNIQGTSISSLRFIFEPVGVTDPRKIKSGTMDRPVTNITKPRLDARFGTSKAIENDDSDDSDEELFFKYEKDQPAGAILKFVINKYMEHYFPAGGRVA